ncbi:MAG: hypothetical protein ACYCPN_02450 [Thermoplasmata archaeon]
MSAAIPSAPAAVGTDRWGIPSPRSKFLRDRGVVRYDTLTADAWRLQGAARILGDAEVGVAEVSDRVTIGGRLTADQVDADGLLEVHGPAGIAGRLRLKGTYRGDSEFHAGEAEIHGLAQFAGPVRVDRVLSVTGLLDAPRVDAGTVVVRGALRVRGDLSATLLDATLRGPSSVEHLTADTVRITREAVPMQSVMPTPLRHLTRQLLGRGGAGLSVLRIDGRSVELEGVHVGYLRADTITVGADCRIDRYDGRILRAHPSSRVGPSSVSPPPYGMTR